MSNWPLVISIFFLIWYNFTSIDCELKLLLSTQEIFSENLKVHISSKYLDNLTLGLSPYLFVRLVIRSFNLIGINNFITAKQEKVFILLSTLITSFFVGKYYLSTNALLLQVPTLVYYLEIICLPLLLSIVFIYVVEDRRSIMSLILAYLGIRLFRVYLYGSYVYGYLIIPSFICFILFSGFLLGTEWFLSKHYNIGSEIVHITIENLLTWLLVILIIFGSSRYLALSAFLILLFLFLNRINSNLVILKDELFIFFYTKWVLLKISIILFCYYLLENLNIILPININILTIYIIMLIVARMNIKS